MFNYDTDNPYSQSQIPYQPSMRQERFYPPGREPFQPQYVRPRPAVPGQNIQQKMSKAEALDLVAKYKRLLIAGSFVTFGVISGLVGSQMIANASSQAAPASNNPNGLPSSDDNFFQQGGGSGFGNGNTWQPPVSTSRHS